MTVEQETPSTTKVFTGPGEYTFAFSAFEEQTVRVDHTDADGVITTLVRDLDYEVTLNVSTIGGHIDVLTSDYTGGTLTISREMLYEQQIDLVGQGRFDPTTLERGLDENVMRIQQLKLYFDEARALINWRGTWATGTTYQERDLVYVPTGATVGWYFCNVQHISGVIADDIAGEYWLMAIDPADVTTGEPALGSPDVSGKVLASTTAGVRSWVDNGEPDLGNPDVDGMALVSTAAGVRSWSPVGSIVPRVDDADYIYSYLTMSPLHVICRDDATYDYWNGHVAFELTKVALRNSASLIGTDIINGVDLVLDTLDATGIIPTTANVLHYHFLVRLTSDGSVTVKSYDTLAGAVADALIDAYVFICATQNAASGGSIPAQYRHGQVFYGDTAMPVLCAATTTTITNYDLEGLIPEVGVESIDLLITGTGTGTITIDVLTGSSGQFVIPVVSGHKLLVTIPYFNGTINIKHTTAGGSVKIHGYRLNRGLR